MASIADKGFMRIDSAIDYLVNITLTNAESFDELAVDNPLRNKICHGCQMNYGAKVHSLKSILAVDTALKLGAMARASVSEKNETEVIIAGRLPRRSTLSCHTVPRRAASC